jgi:hypothetical protein
MLNPGNRHSRENAQEAHPMMNNMTDMKVPPASVDRSTLPIENQSFVSNGEGALSLHFLFQDLTQYQE